MDSMMNFRSFLKALILPTLVGCAIILSAISTASAANAVGSPGQRSDHEECRSLPEDDDFSAERAFDACDRIIKRGDATGDYLAQTYNSRAVELEQSASTDNLTFRPFNSCTDQDKKSGVVNCSDFSNLAIQPESDRLPINSKHLIVKNFELNQVDFKKRVQLIEHLSLIESLSNNPSIDKSVLIEHRRKLTQEINSIDDQQTRFGLLKIPIIAGQIIAHELKREGHYDSAKNRPKLIIDHKEESSQEAITAPGADRQNTDPHNNTVNTPANTPVSVPARPDSP